MTNYLLIGNSIAANSAAARIHARDPGSPITFISDEEVPYYSRCALMYYAMDHCWKRDMFIADREHYRRLNATLVFDRVEGVDAAVHEVHLASGDRRPYDKLLVASGARPRRLGVENEDAEGIYDFTKIKDVDCILADLPRLRRAVVIGGGLIGAEVVEVFHCLKIPVDFIIREPYFYPLFCSEDQGRIIEKRFAHHGVSMHLGRGIRGFEKNPDGRVSAVLDSEGERYEADVVVRSIGVEPNITFLEGSGIECKAGVLVDDRLKNRAPDVWSAGDCAEIQFPGQERAVIQKLWYTAQPQGWIAGENMAGGEVQYQMPPRYQSAMFMDLDFTSYGEMPAPGNDFQEESLVAGNGVDSIRLVHDGNQVVGVSFLGTALTKEDLEHLVTTSMPIREALDKVRNIFGDRPLDRAPRSRIAEHFRLSRRPYFWPFGVEKTWRN